MSFVLDGTLGSIMSKRFIQSLLVIPLALLPFMVSSTGAAGNEPVQKVRTSTPAASVAVSARVVPAKVATLAPPISPIEVSVVKIAKPLVVDAQQMPVASPGTEMLIIPRIAVDAPLRAMGLEADGRMAVPNNFTEIGWYQYGAAPGEAGSAVLGAHVDNGGSTPGVFKRLSELVTGDDIQVVRADGSVIRFRVSGRHVYDRNEKNTGDVFGGSTPRLVLITCYGTWLPLSNTYAQRLVVFADLVH